MAREAAPDGEVLVSVILPVRNQADHIRLIVDEYQAALAPVSAACELILVVNGSRDASATACEEIARRYANVQVAESGAGWGRAVRTGMAAARGDLLCFTNSARTEPADLTLAIRYALVNDRAVVKASRKMRASLVRRVGSLVFNLQARLLFGMAIWDINGTPKVFHRNLVPATALTENGDLLDLEFCIVCHRRGIPVLEMPIFAVRRHGGRSTTNWRSAIAIYLRTCWLYWHARRFSRSVQPARSDAAAAIAQRDLGV